MNSKLWRWPAVAFVVTALILFSLLTSVAADGLSPMEQLGKSIFFDENLSLNQNQSCASCHDPAFGFTGPLSDINAGGSVYEGSIAGAFGNRKPPSAAYATLSPIFHMDKKGLFVGGNFWDGRATGEKLGNPAADQAQGPFLNPAEQALPSAACVVYRVCSPVVPGDYPTSFEAVWGSEACAIDWPKKTEDYCTGDKDKLVLTDAEWQQVYQSYDYVGLTIAAYEASAEVNAFSSKYDLTFNGQATLTKEEQLGYALFRGKGMCQRCHPANGQEALFTDFTFDNLGIPKNPENPVYETDPDFVDMGLGGFLATLYDDPAVYEPEYGKHKVPTLRNVDLRPDASDVKAFSHNGYFKTLEGLVHFYNTRDVKPECPGDYTAAEAKAADCWPAPEVAANVNADELGDLGLTPEEEAAIVAFLRTLSDAPLE